MSTVQLLEQEQNNNIDPVWIQIFKDEKTGGTINDNSHADVMNPNLWTSQVNTDKIEISNKIGYVYPDMPFPSIGFQQAFQYNKMHSEFGNKIHHIHHKNYFSNLIFLFEQHKNKYLCQNIFQTLS